MSDRRNSETIGRKPLGWTRAEAIDILTQCRAIEGSMRVLKRQAQEALRDTTLKIVPTTPKDDPKDWVWENVELRD